MTTPRKGPGHSREREFTVVLEDIHSQFRVFGEGLGDVQNRLERVETDVSQIKQDVSIIKSAITVFAGQISAHDTRITTLEHSR